MLDNKQFQANLIKALGKMKQDTVKGVRLATAHVKIESQKLVPVDEGNLKASAYTSVSVGSYGVAGEIGYTAEYAVYVHEAPMTLKGEERPGKGFFWDPQGTATNKFLENAFYGQEAVILKIIHAAAKL